MTAQKLFNHGRGVQTCINFIAAQANYNRLKQHAVQNYKLKEKKNVGVLGGVVPG